MEYITTKEASAKWGISAIRITILANEGRIPGAQRLGKSWMIPSNATKPTELKGGRYASAVNKKTNPFSFPLYHFRPDWSYIKEAQLSKQEQSLLQAETAVLECRFEDAYQIIESIMPALNGHAHNKQTHDDLYIEIGCLWNAVISCIALNKPDDFSNIFLRLQMILYKDFPHRDDLAIILDVLKTYIETRETIASKNNFNTNIHEQCLPLACLLTGYTILAKESIKLGSADITLLELNLRFLKTSSAVIATEMMHFYLLGIYYLRHNMEEAEKHAKAAVSLAFENKYYFPIVSYYRYFSPVLAPALDQYPEDFHDHCHKLISEYEKNSTEFFSSINDRKFTDEDYTYIYDVIMGLSNEVIANKHGISRQTVNRKLANIREILGVRTKKEMKEYLRNYL